MRSHLLLSVVPFVFVATVAMAQPMVTAQPTDAAPQPMPPGHPRVRATPDARGEPFADRVAGAPDLPPGTVEVILRNERDEPVNGAPVELMVMRHDVAEGDTTEKRRATTDSDGRATFSDNPRDTAHSFRVNAPRGRAAFVSEEFQLASSSTAQRVLLHTYPSTANLQEVMVGLRGMVAVLPREDVFQVEATFDVFNIGRTAWVPDGAGIELPIGAKAVRAREEGSARLVAEGDRLRFSGTFAPGQHQVGYTFQIENTGEPDLTLRVPLPGHVAELRVVSEAPRGLSLSVDDFPAPERMRGQNGNWLWVTGKQMVRGDAALSDALITLRGLPVPSTGRWVAVALSLVVAGTGIWSATAGRGGKKTKPAIAKEDAAQARRLLLDELVLLERLRARGDVGPKTYQSSREVLLDALARIELAVGIPTKKTS